MLMGMPQQFPQPGTTPRWPPWQGMTGHPSSQMGPSMYHQAMTMPPPQSQQHVQATPQQYGMSAQSQVQSSIGGQPMGQQVHYHGPGSQSGGGTMHYQVVQGRDGEQIVQQVPYPASSVPPGQMPQQIQGHQIHQGHPPHAQRSQVGGSLVAPVPQQGFAAQYQMGPGSPASQMTTHQQASQPIRAPVPVGVEVVSGPTPSLQVVEELQPQLTQHEQHEQKDGMDQEVMQVSQHQPQVFQVQAQPVAREQAPLQGPPQSQTLLQAQAVQPLPTQHMVQAQGHAGPPPTQQVLQGQVMQAQQPHPYTVPAPQPRKYVQPHLPNTVPTIDGVEHIDPEAILELLRQRPSHMVLVDLRGEDRAAGLIEGAVHVPAIDKVPFVSKVPDLVRQWADHPLVVFTCQYSAHRAPQCANWYREKADPRQRVGILSGGFRGWEARGLPVTSAATGEEQSKAADAFAMQQGVHFVQQYAVRDARGILRVVHTSSGR
eukprot:gnl/TRDRNA2_/TRDRNA2_82570_c0_seq1.p1 gnl/TRDRNA2_/TRDRNA2_82570_c0~~gnl/TRDRNA2_/TRDRNA2_82570_c0_seq1.p1  ORF type:complete len:486 (-),score=82.83 gnl/TRDRNA2_/TRDRNA2_82570_c0_seq1:272-1729(-)